MIHSPTGAAAPSILVWGAGAIGATVGAALVRAGYDVTFVDTVAEHVAAMADPAQGLRIEGPVDPHHVRALRAFTPDMLKGKFSCVLLAVKSQYTDAAMRAVLPHLTDDGYVVSLQNGMCEPTIAAHAGWARTIGAFVNFSADWIAPGQVMYGGRGAFVLGEADGRITDRLRALHDMIRVFEPDAIMTDNIFGYLWGKLGYVSLLFAQGLGEMGIADCLARPELEGLWRKLAGETMAVSQAEGVTPIGFNGFDPAAFMPGATARQAHDSIAAMVAFNRPNAKTHSGIWRDLWVRHRRTEVDAQIGYVVACADRHAIACPALKGLVRQIHECEDGTRPMSDLNLAELASL